MAEPGVVGLLVIVLATALNGVTEEHRIGHAFEEALPFTALLVVFFAVVAVIDQQGLFRPISDYVLTLEGATRTSMFYLANGVLSMISDNVFVATVYITEVAEIFNAGDLTREQFDALAVAINASPISAPRSSSGVPRASRLASLKTSTAFDSAIRRRSRSRTSTSTLNV